MFSVTFCSQSLMAKRGKEPPRKETTMSEKTAEPKIETLVVVAECGWGTELEFELQPPGQEPRYQSLREYLPEETSDSAW